MPMIPETVVAMLACARLGAPHTVVFGGFSSDALRGRILDCDAHFVITADGGYRRGAASPLKAAVDEAVAGCPDVEKVLVVRRTGQDVAWNEGRDVWWHDVVDRQPTTHEAEAFDAEHPLYIMYTSGTTAKPKGILHTSGGYLTHVSATHRLIFDIKPEEDVYWTAADIGWVTGHSYIVYGPLANATTSVMYEGTPDTPARDRWWQIIEKYKVNILYTAPTTIRTFMKWGEDLPAGHDLSSLRLLGSVGEPINPEAWIWYRTHIGRDNCPIVDTWWQTETGGILITPAAGHHRHQARRGHDAVPRHLGRHHRQRRALGRQRRGRLPGHHRAVARHAARHLGRRRALQGDLLVALSRALLRRRRGQAGPGRRHLAAGPGRRRHEHLGPPDLDHRGRARPGEPPRVAEAAVVGASDATTGQAIVAFVTVKGTGFDDAAEGEKFVAELRDHVAHEIGPIAKPRQIILTPELPKTRSGKIMRRLLRDVAEHRDLGDVTTLMDPTVVNAIKEGMASGAEDKE